MSLDNFSLSIPLICYSNSQWFIRYLENCAHWCPQLPPIQVYFKPTSCIENMEIKVLTIWTLLFLRNKLVNVNIIRTQSMLARMFINYLSGDCLIKSTITFPTQELTPTVRLLLAMESLAGHNTSQLGQLTEPHDVKSSFGKRATSCHSRFSLLFIMPSCLE